MSTRATERVEEHSEAVLSFHPLGPRDQTQVSRFSSKFLYLLSYFADPALEMFTKLSFTVSSQVVLKVHKTTFRYNS